MLKFWSSTPFATTKNLLSISGFGW